MVYADLPSLRLHFGARDRHEQLIIADEVRLAGIRLAELLETDF